MERTISAVIGKGSVKHNKRAFIASNVDGSRTGDNIEYIDIDIKSAYHQLFDEALMKYNARQSREDRMISDYYEKIRTGKQEKLFHEVIFQVGNKDDCNASSENGKIAKEILDEYMQSFQSRNPNLFVFSAHMHMDEETPHLHVDFIPFISGSTRGLETRVSLKQALAKQGFTGGTKGDTEWNQWIHSEKKQLAKVMKKHNIEWCQLDTHNKHLSVLDYEKQQRSEEVKALTEKKNKLNKDIDNMEKSYAAISEEKLTIDEIARNITDKDFWNLEEPSGIVTAKSYFQAKVLPFFQKVKKFVQNLIDKYLHVYYEYQILHHENFNLKMDISDLKDENNKLRDSIHNATINENRLKTNIRTQQIAINKIKSSIGQEAYSKLTEEKTRKEKGIAK